MCPFVAVIDVQDLGLQQFPNADETWLDCRVYRACFYARTKASGRDYGVLLSVDTEADVVITSFGDAHGFLRSGVAAGTTSFRAVLDTFRCSVVSSADNSVVPDDDRADGSTQTIRSFGYGLRKPHVVPVPVEFFAHTAPYLF